MKCYSGAFHSLHIHNLKTVIHAATLRAVPRVRQTGTINVFSSGCYLGICVGLRVCFCSCLITAGQMHEINLKNVSEKQLFFKVIYVLDTFVFLKINIDIKKIGLLFFHLSKEFTMLEKIPKLFE